MEADIRPFKLSTSGAPMYNNGPNDEGIFLDAIEPAPGIVITGAIIQTYLDHSSGERDKKPLNLRNEWMEW